MSSPTANCMATVLLVPNGRRREGLQHPSLLLSPWARGELGTLLCPQCFTQTSPALILGRCWLNTSPAHPLPKIMPQHGTSCPWAEDDRGIKATRNEDTGPAEKDSHHTAVPAVLLPSLQPSLLRKGEAQNVGQRESSSMVSFFRNSWISRHNVSMLAGLMALGWGRSSLERAMLEMGSSVRCHRAAAQLPLSPG